MEVEVTDQTQESPVGQNKNRYEKIFSKLRMEHLSEEEKRCLKDICFEYQDVFSLLAD